MSTAAEPEWKQATDLLLERLVKLDAAGDSGFEGLMRDMLVELTNMPFNLAKSGPQGGSDVRSEPSNFFNIGLEAKRYRKGTKLPVDQLKAKITEAARADQPIDLWILAASRPISVTDREDLSELASQEGIKVLVLDWTDIGAIPPVFAFALVSSPNALKTHLGEDAELTQALNTLRKTPNFDVHVSNLRADLEAADTGYVAASRAVKQWLMESQSKSRTALARLKGHHDLKSAGTKLVERSGVAEGLDNWWSSTSPTHVLLGDEGTGKSWAALSWWNKLAGEQVEPLAIYLSAKDVGSNDPIQHIANCLARYTGLRTTEFWLRRLVLWAKSDKALPILLILDGLNQNFNKRDWVGFLQPLLADELDGRFRVLMTCWPDWWSSMGELLHLEPAPTSQSVVNFSDLELDALLNQHGLERANFGSDLIEMMKVPRLFHLAIKHRIELEGSGDVTAERLAYEDWKHRLKLGTARADWSDIEFRDFLAGLGSELGANLGATTLTTRELTERLGCESGAEQLDLKATIQDLVAGRWLQSTTTPHRYRVNQDMVPFVLGVALSSQMRAVEGIETANAKLADFIDPYRGQSLGVAVIRAAVTAALIDPSVGRDARKALLLRWLQEQNFRVVDFEAWWRLIGTDTELFCSLVEEQWLHQSGSFSEDEVFIKGFANAYEHEKVAPTICNAVTRWLGLVWPDPDEGQFLGKVDPDSDRSKENRAKVLENLNSWAQQRDKSDWPQIQLFAEGNVSWLSHRVFGILSFLPRMPLRKAYEAWAISRSILGRHRHFDELAWVLRLNGEDEVAAREMVFSIVDRLEIRSKRETSRAAQWLLEALGDKSSLDRAASIEASTAGDQGKVPIAANHSALRSFFDPNSSDELGPLKIPNGADLWPFSMSRGKSDLTFEEVKAPLCRNDPPSLVSVLSQSVASASERTDEQLTGLSNHIKEFVLVLNDAERAALAKELRDRASNNDEVTAKGWLRTAGLLDLWGQTALEQFKTLESTKFDAATLEGMLEALSTATDEEAASIASLLPDAVDEEAQNVVLYFLLETNAPEAAKNWPPLETLVLHNNEVIRHRAIRVAATGKSEAALGAFNASGWIANEDQSRDEKAYGSLALSCAADLFDDPGLLDRADPEIWGWRLQHAADKETSLDKFHDFLRERVVGEDRRKTRSFPRNAWDHKDAIRSLLTKRSADFFEWFTPWLDDHLKLPWGSLHETFPLLDLARVLIETGHPDGRRLWERLLKAEKTGIHKFPDLHFFPLFSPDFSADTSFLASVSDSLITDEKIRDFVWFAFKANRGEWLANLIREDVVAGSAYRQARGWKLLGYTDAEELFCGLWGELDAHRPNRGWLRDVANRAEDEFNHNVWARHWYELHIKSKDAISSYANYQLMSGCVDGRARLWMKNNPLNTAPLGEVVRSHWILNSGSLNNDIKDRKKNEKEQLFGMVTMRQTQAPWY
ncbi:hypothetical protein K3757_13915 [Sulfitobacter sp. S223]|uniref:hypothetical protein n=1 Tax=Sulfitobacter sp. S223 TaxID=2867023 RepID=UPI0021A8C61D|nr:hypothetical protein [Sulfitobacter sp. S223]UWR25546.1 hypothetical protein K3757_13915 [Sulfitobacter sp. S223]